MDRGSRPIPFAGCLTDRSPRRGDLVLVGLPDDSRSSFRRGPAEAPQTVRDVYDGEGINSCTELGVDLAGRVVDLGDWQPSDGWDETRLFYRRNAEDLFSSGFVPFFIGGDHAVTIPVVEALRAVGEPVYLVQVDAHPDLYSEFRDDRFSHACVASRALEQNHVAGLTQLGIRVTNPEQRSQGKRWGDRLRATEARRLTDAVPHPGHIPDNAPVYVTFDIDAVDPAFAPGVSHPAPGGLTARQALNWIQGFPWKLVGMDLVEVNPQFDVRGQTAFLAGRLLHEAMGKAFAQG